MKIYIGADHAGYEMKEKLIDYLTGLGYEVGDKGAFEYKEDDDYPDFVFPVALSVVENKESFGVVLGGSGQGEAIAANRVAGARAVVFYGQKEPVTSVDVKDTMTSDSFEIIKLAREHNNANILSIGARFVTLDEAKFAIELFLNTKFEQQERHLRRIDKIEGVK